MMIQPDLMAVVVSVASLLFGVHLWVIKLLIHDGIVTNNKELLKQMNGTYIRSGEMHPWCESVERRLDRIETQLE